MSESCKQALLLIAITVCLVLVLNPSALTSVQALGQRRAELPRRVLSTAEMQQFTTTANTGEIVMVGSNGVLIDQGTQALRVGTSDVTLITGGAERLKVMNDGVVKINSTNADALYWYDAATNNLVGGLGNSGGTDKGWVGLYDGATQKVALRANGVSTFTGGDVGIGTTTPIFRTSIVYQGDNDSSTTSKYNFGLQVSNTVASGPNNRSNLILFTDGNSSQGAIGGYRMAWSQHYLGGLQFLVGSHPTGFKQGPPLSTAEASGSLTEAMRIDPYGNVGIGTNNPTYLLELSNPTGNSSQPFMRIGNTVGGNSSHKVGIILAPFTGTTAGGTNTPYSGQSSQIAAIDDGAASSHLTFWTTPAMAATPAVERMRITNSGNVGIGTTNPMSKLMVSNLGSNYNGPVLTVDAGIPGDTTAGAPRGIGQPLIGVGSLSYTGQTLTGDYYGIGFGYTGGLSSNYHAAEIGLMVTYSSGNEMGDLVFSTRPNTSNSKADERMRIRSDGNVGIGTANPDSSLTITRGDGSLIGFTPPTGEPQTYNFKLKQVSADIGGAPGYNYNFDRTQFAGFNGTQLCMKWNGNVGIATNDPGDRLHVNGGVVCNAVYPQVDAAHNCGLSVRRWALVYAANGTIQTSDSKEKDAVPLPYGLKEILQMRTIKYKWKTQASLPDNDPAKNFEYYGFCADELSPLFPELVYDEDKSAPIQMNYSEILPVMVNAIKEQQQIIQNLNSRLVKLESLLSR